MTTTASPDGKRLCTRETKTYMHWLRIDTHGKELIKQARLPPFCKNNTALEAARAAHCCLALFAPNESCLCRDPNGTEFAVGIPASSLQACHLRVRAHPWVDLAAWQHRNTGVSKGRLRTHPWVDLRAQKHRNTGMSRRCRRTRCSRRSGSRCWNMNWRNWSTRGRGRRRGSSWNGNCREKSLLAAGIIQWMRRAVRKPFRCI